MKMNIESISTTVFSANSNLNNFLISHLECYNLESKVLVVTSKIVSLAENRLINTDSISKDELVKKEADYYFGKIGYDVHLTIKHGLLIPSAGIDESNSPHQDFILYPENPTLSCKKIQETLSQHFQLKNFGVILSDSHTTPLRRGVTGVALAHWGFHGIENKVGSHDIFGRPLKYTTMNWADALASAATILMGESNETRPLAIISCEGVQFQKENSIISIPLEEDLYAPLLKGKI